MGSQGVSSDGADGRGRHLLAVDGLGGGHNGRAGADATRGAHPSLALGEREARAQLMHAGLRGGGRRRGRGRGGLKGPVQEVGTAGRRPWTLRRIATRTHGNAFAFPSGFVRRPARSTGVPVAPPVLGRTPR